MAEGVAEYLSSDSYSVEFGDITKLIVKEVSGWQVDMSPSGADNTVGSGPKGKAVVRSVPSQPKYGNLKLVIIPGEHQEGDDEKLWKWYSDCVSKANLGEAAKGRSLRKDAKVTVYYSGAEGKAGLQFDFQGVFPSSFDVPKRDAGSAELETWTFEFQFERMKFSVKDP